MELSGMFTTQGMLLLLLVLGYVLTRIGIIAEGIFGSLGVLYASVYVIPQRIIMWTLGVSYFEGTSDKKAALRRVAMNPCVLAVAAGLVIMLAQLHLPGVGEQLAAKCVVASTLLSLATIPLWCLLVR